MIQFNLLPDVKVEYIKARRTKRLVTLISVGLSALSVFVLLLSLITVDVVQKKSLRDLDKDIASNSKTLKAVPNIDKILTVQNQLNTLPGLHDSKPVTSRIFGYLAQLTPTGASLSGLKLDLTANTMEISGAAPSLDVVNKFADTLKATTYVTYTPDEAGQKQQADDDAAYKATGKYPNNPASPAKPAFSSVVLSSFTKNSTGANYTINMSFDAPIFANTNYTTLRVPTDTVSNTSILFKKAGA